MAREPNTYRFQGKSVFLTYPHCPFHTLFIIDYLYQLLDSWVPTYARACVEPHADGTPHLHVLVQLEKKLTTRNQRFFDIKDPNLEGTIYHPHVQCPRRDADVADYIAKGGAIEERGIFAASRRSPAKSRDALWGRLLTESTSKSDFLSRVQSEQPYIWATQLRALEYAATKQWPEPPSSYAPRWNNFPNVPPEAKAWVDENIYVVSRDSMELMGSNLSRSDMEWAHDYTYDELSVFVLGPPPLPDVFDVDSGPRE